MWALPQVYDNESHPLLTFDRVVRLITVHLSVVFTPAIIPEETQGSLSLPQVAQAVWVVLRNGGWGWGCLAFGALRPSPCNSEVVM